MTTHLFLSWSGEQSRRIAETLRTWIPTVLQHTVPYFTPDDIQKGAKWNTEITESLSRCNVGVICLTPENVEAPWILFEAGAISKQFEDARVSSILFGLDPSDISSPLASFQNTPFEKSEIRRLLNTINDCETETPLSSEVLDRAFEMWWPELENDIKEIMSSRDVKSKSVRSNRDIAEETLEICRFLLKKGHAESAINEAKNALVLPENLVHDLFDVSMRLRLMSNDVEVHPENAIRSFESMSERLMRAAEYLEEYMIQNSPTGFRRRLRISENPNIVRKEFLGK